MDLKFPTKSFHLNAALHFFAGIFQVLESLEVELFEEDQIVVLEFKESLPIGLGVLNMEFEGTLNDRMKGFYRR